MIEFLSYDILRPKVINAINKYLSLSKHQSLRVGIYRDGRLFVFGDGENLLTAEYDIGSISKTMTAHLILKLRDQGLLDTEKSIAEYISLPEGDYPTVYELLTHTAGYGHLTPAEITVPALLQHGYARKNIYDRCNAGTIISCLKKRRRNRRVKEGYGYSDFAYAILGVIAERVTGIAFADLFEDFVQSTLGMRDTVIEADRKKREPKAVHGRRIIDFWRWERDNPYIAGGGLISNVADMLSYVAMQIESSEKYITSAHRICQKSLSERQNIALCVGWHTYKKSNQLWHVGGVGTFRSSVIFNKKRRIGVVVLGNSKGVASANVHYLAKMLYSEIKINKIKV